jgi:hypothetical protein
MRVSGICKLSGTPEWGGTRSLCPLSSTEFVELGEITGSRIYFLHHWALVSAAVCVCDTHKKHTAQC